MFDLQNFCYNGKTMSVLVANKTGKLFFDASNVCDVLGHTNPSMAIQGLDEDEKALFDREVFDPKKSLGSKGGVQQKWFVNETGLYSLILRSNKTEAKQFRRWVTHEVLPAIRKTGTYTVDLDLGKIARAIVEAKKAAKAMGASETSARKKAADIVKKMHQVDIYELLGMDKPSEDEIKRMEKEEKLDEVSRHILAWAKKHGKTLIKPRDLHQYKVRGCVPTSEAREQMQRLVEECQAEWEVNNRVLRIYDAEN